MAEAAPVLPRGLHNPRTGTERNPPMQKLILIINMLQNYSHIHPKQLLSCFFLTSIPLWTTLPPNIM